MKPKKYLSILKSGFHCLCLFFPVTLPAQYSFDFENENLELWQQTTNGHWETSNINPLNGNFSLHHCFDDAQSSFDQISFPYSTIPDKNQNITWTFSVRHGYNPSTSNNWAVFLCSDMPNKFMHPESSANALILGVNYTGSEDCLILWKQYNGKITSILKSEINWEESIKDSSALLAISRNSEGQWQLKLFNKNGKELETTSASDSFFPTPLFSGLYYKYSSSQDQKLWFDNYKILGSFYEDKEAPRIDSFYIKSRTSITVVFNEPIDSTKITKENFSIKQSISSITFPKLTTCILELENPLESNKEIELFIYNIPDNYGNALTEKQVNLNFYEPKAFDVLITEIMFDPLPALQLPPYEYIELFNNSEKLINLKHWQLNIGSTSFDLPDINFQPKTYLILTKKEQEQEFAKLSNTLGLFTSEYTISNEGFFIVLKDTVGNFISFSKFESHWINGVKSEGGWAIEMVDIDNPCNTKSNWRISTSTKGGTPGADNSVKDTNPDRKSPEITNIRSINDSSLILEFSESIISDTLLSTQSYFCDLLGYPQKVVYENESLESLKLIFKDTFELKKLYHLYISNNVCDCSGNALTQKEFTFAKTEEATASDVIINEILFDAYTGSSKFVEVFNRSKKVIDAGKIFLCTYDTLTHELFSHTPLTSIGHALFPDSFLAYTSNIEELQKHYSLKKPHSIIESKNFPTLDDKQGLLSIVNSKFETLDSTYYSCHFHTSFLSSKEGVSLEKISSEASSLSSANWQSAAQTAGFATPGYENSAKYEFSQENKELKISPEVFTPNGDGIDDRIFITLPSRNVPAKTSIMIYAASGLLVKTLVQQSYTQSNYTITWDGSNSANQLVSSGIYVIYIQSFFEKGKTETIKKTCILSRK